MLNATLKIAGQKPVGQGKTRLIYPHPDNPDWLIKVHRSRYADGGSNWWQRAEDRFLFRTGILRELGPYLDSRYDSANAPLQEHIAPIIGVVDTDLGLGLVVTAMRGRDGTLAPTARRLLKQRRMTQAQVKAIRLLLDRILQCPMVLGDLNQDNIVLAPDADTGAERAVLIDGLGDRTWIPVRHWSRWLNRRSKRQFVQKMQRKLDAVENQ